MDVEQQAIVVGGIVHLKSGSPDLRVIGASEEEIEASWNDEGETRTSTIPRVCLTPQAVLPAPKHDLQSPLPSRE